MSSDYEFVTVWRVPGTIAEVKAVLSDGRTLPQWWPAVYLGVEPREDGDPENAGSVTGLHTKGWLPYTLRGSLTVTEPVMATGFALSADGDLQGNRPEDVRPGRAGSGDHLRLAGQRREAAATQAHLAAAPGLRGEPPLGHGAGRGEPATGVAPAAGG